MEQGQLGLVEQAQEVINNKENARARDIIADTLNELSKTERHLAQLRTYVAAMRGMNAREVIEAKDKGLFNTKQDSIENDNRYSLGNLTLRAV